MLRNIAIAFYRAYHALSINRNLRIIRVGRPRIIDLKTCIYFLHVARAGGYFVRPKIIFFECIGRIVDLRSAEHC